MKKQIIDKLREDGMTEVAAAKTLDTVIQAIGDVVRATGEASIPGFGKFKKKLRAERQVHNPRTGEVTRTTAKDVLVFKPSSTFTF